MPPAARLVCKEFAEAGRTSITRYRIPFLPKCPDDPDGFACALRSGSLQRLRPALSEVDEVHIFYVRFSEYAPTPVFSGSLMRGLLALLPKRLALHWMEMDGDAHWVLDRSSFPLALHGCSNVDTPVVPCNAVSPMRDPCNPLPSCLCTVLLACFPSL